MLLSAVFVFSMIPSLRTITEVKGNAAGISYDTAAYTVTITVTDNGAGQLVATTEYSADPVFRNTYEAPVVEDKNPQTGDSSNLTVFIAMATLSMFSLLAVLLIGKKKLFGE